MREAVILAGGRGSRLREVIGDGVPKPMAEVAGRPFLAFLLDRLSDQRMRHVVLATGYRSEAIERCFKDGYRGMRLEYSRERTPLGTGGALARALGLCRGEWVLALNADSYCGFDYGGLMEAKDAALSRDPGVACIVGCTRAPGEARYGSIAVDKENRIASFREKGQGDGSPLVSAGVYLIKADALSGFPQVFSLEHGFLERACIEGRLYAHVIDGPFVDMGTPEGYAHAQDVMQGVPTSHAIAFFDRDGTINVDTGHLHNPKDLVLIPKAVDLIRHHNERGHKVVVVTNQAGIAKGLYTEGDMHALHDALDDALAKEGAFVDAYYFCPHHPDYTGECACRKPRPGMLIRALVEFGADPRECVMYGDSPKDAQAAQGAGVEFLSMEENCLK